ncbi:hypothetical protein [[Mycoplasma] mobile]|uniref:Expressed protein n=1 Tax=Mycoplasma mobile (strain ATCC 43663 / 163K / NCTC 11711) TaxID=267748 RepID=Q6KIF5_MYCM1|nr:hypothetical protein [[Mycoplasma] mobile]AAT27621.1 expressed protein [Mycoplasma mobile 163K]
MKKRTKIIAFSLIATSVVSIVVPTTIVLVNQNQKIEENKNFAKQILNFIEKNQKTNNQVRIRTNSVSIFQISKRNFENFLENKPIIENIIGLLGISLNSQSISLSTEFVDKNINPNPNMIINFAIELGEGSARVKESINISVTNGFQTSETYLNKIKLNYENNFTSGQIKLRNSASIENLDENNLVQNLIGIEIFSNTKISTYNFIKNNEARTINFGFKISLIDSQIFDQTIIFTINF